MAEGRYAKVNGIELYYELHGTGRPLVMLHGGLGGVEMFGPLLPELSRSRQVIGVELQGHMHTADIERPMSFEAMADDVAALVRHLAPAETDLLGYSLGGGVALQTAIRHPEIVRKLVLMSTPFASKGWYPEVRKGQASINPDLTLGSPLHQAYTSVAPRPGDWPAMVRKLSKMLAQDYDWSKEVEAIRSPVMIVVGDADAILPEHTVEFFKLRGGGQRDAGWDGSGMPNSRLAVLPGVTHYNVPSAPGLGAMIEAFLDAPMPRKG